MNVMLEYITVMVMPSAPIVKDLSAVPVTVVITVMESHVLVSVSGLVLKSLICDYLCCAMQTRYILFTDVIMGNKYVCMSLAPTLSKVSLINALMATMVPYSQNKLDFILSFDMYNV